MDVEQMDTSTATLAGTSLSMEAGSSKKVPAAGRVAGRTKRLVGEVCFHPQAIPMVGSSARDRRLLLLFLLLASREGALDQELFISGITLDTPGRRRSHGRRAVRLRSATRHELVGVG
jgi:hypothetical protein